MEAWLILLLSVIGLIFILPPVALFKALRAQREIESLKARLRALEDQRFGVAPESASETIAEKYEVPPVIPPAPPPPLKVVSE